MISTVTTTTVTTVTTVALAASLGLIAIVVLLSLLIQKEVLTASSSSNARAFSRTLNMAIVPLLIGFAFIGIVRVLETLR